MNVIRNEAKAQFGDETTLKADSRLYHTVDLLEINKTFKKQKTKKYDVNTCTKQGPLENIESKNPSSSWTTKQKMDENCIANLRKEDHMK